MINFRIFYASILFVLLLAVKLKSQDQGYAPSPSVSAPSTAKNATTFVDEYSGAASTNVPLAPIKAESYTLPISLNYSSQGIKVGEIAGWVGMGWNLNTGGVITRQINDLPDEMILNNQAVGYLYNGTEVDNISNKDILSLSSDEQDFIFSETQDTEPDVFSFNIGNGISGKFFFDKNGDPVLESKSDLKIQYGLRDNYGPSYDHNFLQQVNNKGLITVFTIITPDGFRFRFDARSYTISSEIGQLSYRSSNPFDSIFYSTDCSPMLSNPYQSIDYSEVSAVVTAWHLTSITSPYQDYQENPYTHSDISFSYVDEMYMDHSQIFQWRSKTCDGLPTTNYYTSSNVNLFIQKRLSEINYGDGSLNYGKVEFIANQLRDDIYEPNTFNYPKPKALTSIKYYSGGEKVKEYSLNYGWFNQTSHSCPQPEEPFMQAHRKRLKLESITEQNGAKSLPPYEFDYDDTPLPPRHSANIDYWGYYNGSSDNYFRPQLYAYPQDNVNNDKYISIFSIYQRGGYAGNQVTVSGANRAPNASFSKAGILTSVTNPLGGKVIMMHEANDFLYEGITHVGGGLRVKSIEIQDAKNNNIITTYYYDTNEDGSGTTTGKLLDMPTFAVLRKTANCSRTNWSDLAIISSLDYKMSSGSSSVGYKRVTKKTSKGKTVSEYYMGVEYGTQTDDCPNGICMYEQSESVRVAAPPYPDNHPSPPNPNYEWRNRLPVKQTVYNLQGNKVQETSFQYSINEYDKINGIKVHNIQGFPHAYLREWGKYYLLSADYKLVKRTNTTYGELGNSLTTEIHYEYNGVDHDLMTASYTDNSNGVRHRIEYYYPQDIGDSALVSEHRINIPMEVIKKTGTPGNLTKSDGYKIKFNTFADTLSNGKYTIPGPNDNGTYYNIYAPHEFYRWKITTMSWELEKTHKSYTRSGLLLKYDSPGNQETEYTFVDGLLDSKQFNSDWVWSYSYHTDRMLHTVTEPDGLETSYGYDDLNRLQSVTDRGGDRVEQYDYTFQLASGGDNKIRTAYTYTGMSNIPPVSEYYDGVGRSISTRLENYTPSGTDYTTSKQYDNAGRMTQQCDPASGGCTTYYYEDNPLARLREQNAPGWSRKPRTRYLVNTASDNVKKTPSSYYPAGSLYKYEYRDENHNYAYEFKDKLGRTVLKRRKVNATQFADTYYRYDGKGNLTNVIPPGAADGNDPLSYKYEYYDNDQIKRKYIPGAGWYEYEYYPDDLLKKETDPGGHITKYFYNTFNQIEYITDGNDNILKEYTYSTATSGINVGKVIGIDTRVLGTSDMLHTGYKYDQYGRVEMDTIDNYLGGRDEHTYTYDMNDNIKTIEQDHYDSSSSTTPDKEVDKRYEYDDAGRLTGVFMSVDGGTEVQLSEQVYDDKDRLIEKNLGKLTGDELQSVDYAYNSRGWLKRINDIYRGQAPSCSGGGGPGPGPGMMMMANGGGAEGYDEEVTVDGKVTFTYSPDAIRAQYQTHIDVYLDLELSAGATDLGAIEEEVKIPIQGEQAQTSLSLHTETLVVEGVANFKDISAAIAASMQRHTEEKFFPADISQEQAHQVQTDIESGLDQMAMSSLTAPAEDDLFAESLYYDSDDSDLNAVEQYNGNIAYLKWRVSDRVIQNYGFTYDNLDRLTDAKFAELDPEENCPEYYNYDRYNVNIEYEDHRGNIGDIERRGVNGGTPSNPTFGMIDNITLNYNGQNQPGVVYESSSTSRGFNGNIGTLSYDNNGNLTSDNSRDITVTYNRLNLPEQITVNNSSFTGTITFTYDYDGNLLKRVVSQSSPSALSVTTEYAGGMEYVNGTLQSIYHEEGRYVKNGSTWHHEYVIRDHLGNNRIFFSDTNGNGAISTSEVSQEAHYYPFGMAMQGNWLSTSLPENKYRYNGIEQTTNLGLDVYNAFYRTLDPSLARWWQVDPEAESLYGLSPYNAMNNNPVLLNDPNGDLPPVLAAIALTSLVTGIGNTVANYTPGMTLSEGLAYFTVGAGAGGAAFVNPAAAGSILALGNLSVKGINGDLSNIDSFGDFALLGVTTILDFAGGYAGGLATKTVYSRLRPSGSLSPSEVQAISREGIDLSTTKEFGVGLKKSMVTEKTVSSVQNARLAVGSAAKTSTSLLNAAPARLTQKGLDHIIARHWFTSGAKGAGKFAQDMTGKQLKSMIQTATTRGTFRPNTMGRAGTIAEYNFGRVIGTNMNGGAATNLRVVIGPNGNVITAFPF